MIAKIIKEIYQVQNELYANKEDLEIVIIMKTTLYDNILTTFRHSPYFWPNKIVGKKIYFNNYMIEDYLVCTESKNIM